MDKNQKPEDSITQAESLGIFNTYSVEVRSKIDGLVKQVLFISAGVQAITIGAFLSGNPPQLPINAVYLLKCGWFALSISIVLSLCFMLGQVLAMIAVGLRFKSKLESGRKSADLLMAQCQCVSSTGSLGSALLLHVRSAQWRFHSPQCAS
jgi:uncharacterized membrane protein YciS (DUF1049 family)